MLTITKNPNLIYLLIAGAFFVGFLVLGAEEPDLIVTWKANNYTPAWYLGKKIPIAKTKVDVALQVLENNKLVDLSETEIRWYLDNKLRITGAGRANFSFNAPSTGQGSVIIRVSLPDYKDSEFNKFIVIPIKIPEIVTFKGKTDLKAWPYFFNVINEDEVVIELEETNESLTARAFNKNDRLEVAREQILKNQ